MKLRIDIDTKTFIRFWLVMICFGLAGLMIYSARDALMILGTALFLALALSKPVAKLARIFPGKSRLGATAIAFLSLIVIIGGIIWFVVPTVIHQSAKFAQTLPALVDQANGQWAGLRDFIDNNGLRPQVDETVNTIKEQASSWATGIGGSILDTFGSLASFLVSLVLVIVLTFLMLLEGPVWMKRIWSLYNNKARMKHHKVLVSKVYDVVTGYITSQLTISGIGSLVAGSVVFVIGFIFPAVDSGLAMPTILLTFLLTLIPMFGSTIAGAVIGLLLLFSDPTAAIVYLVFFITYQQIENNFIAPAIQAKKLDLSALAVLASVTVGLYVGGLVGGVIAIPIAGTIKVFLEDYLARAKIRQEETEKPTRKILKKIRGES